MFPILLKLGPITLHTYGLMVALGFLAGLHATRIQFERQGLPLMQIDRMVLSIMIAGLLGARIFYFGVDNFAELKVDPLSFLRIWEGGLVFYGGVLGGLMVLVYFSQVQRLPFLSLTDAFSVPLLLAHSIGRLGCFAAGCCYGKETALPWGVTYGHPASLAPRFISLHPTQLYESLAAFLLFLAFNKANQKRLKLGTLTAAYMILYGTFRFFIENLRGDDRGLYHFGASPSQLVAVTMVVIGFLILGWSQRGQS